MANEVGYSSDLRVLTQHARQQIEQDIERLSASLASGQSVKLRLGDDSEAEIALPASTLELIRQALTLERDGKGFLLFAADVEVSPEEAADLLGLFKSTLLKKLEDGDIPFRLVNAQRRIAIADLVAYRNKQHARAQSALQQMRDEADELGIYE